MTNLEVEHDGSVGGVSKFWRYYALFSLCLVNALNFVDRYVSSGAKQAIIDDLKIDDTESGFLSSAFLIFYVIGSPLFGILSDFGFSKRLLLFIGICVWSIATASSYFAPNYYVLLALRMVVGFGEASYAVVGPVVLSQLFPGKQTNRAFAIFYACTPVGAAFGFYLGGMLAEKLSWRFAFLITGLPGLLVALLMFGIKEANRLDSLENQIQSQGYNDHHNHKRNRIPLLKSMKYLFTNKSFVFAMIGGIWITAAIGCIADWMPTFIQRQHGASKKKKKKKEKETEIPHMICFQILGQQTAGLLSGIATLIGGILGSFLGSLFADRLIGKIRNPYFAVSSFSLIPSIGLSILFMWITK